MPKFSNEQILEQVGRIEEACPEFRKTNGRLRQLLSYTVAAFLAGRQITERDGAIECLSKGLSFNPRGSSLARTLLTRLRQALDRYYMEAGANDEVVISVRASELPRGLK